MAPTITAAITNSQEHLTLTHKLRKPLVEKLRRERINSSIEQLKSLLNPEFLKQQPDSKMEKADILEMTVCFLTHVQQQNQQQRTLLNHINKLQPSSDNSLIEADFSPLSSTVQTSITKDKESSQQRPLEAVVDTYTLELQPDNI
uniref:Transcription factor HES-5 n=1 Tax=Amphiprion percula TaxID=161767 RepID=A0A3P8U1Q8_AMPPE